MIGLQRLETGLGPVQVAFDGDGAVIYLGFPDHEFRTALLAKVQSLGPAPQVPAAILGRLALQLDAYAAGRRRAFDLPFRLHGSPFEQRVWAGLLRIPYGELRS